MDQQIITILIIIIIFVITDEGIEWLQQKYSTWEMESLCLYLEWLSIEYALH